ncbi:MAG: bifunctional serine/threonine-protein kinase/formylglycine-generating enzyme family protein [Myxococcota bacterium]
MVADGQKGPQGASGDPDPWIGKRLRDRFRIVRLLGEGGMAWVYYAVDEELDDRPMVVKIPKAAILNNPSNRRRFVQEVRSLVRQRHPNIVRVYDAGEHDGHPFLVVEYLDGGDLSARLAQAGGKLDAARILAWLPTVAGALDAVHQRGVVHRDVKPGNILFDADGHPFLSDFGIAAQMGSDAAGGSGEDEGQITVAGGFVGSPAFAPPEAIQRELSGAYDQYSLAVVVYRALSGRLPYEGVTAEEYLVSKIRDEPLALESLATDAPAGCVAAVMRAMSKRPSLRFASCREFADAFAAGAAVATTLPSGASHTRSEAHTQVGAAPAASAPPARSSLPASPGRRAWVRPAAAAGVLLASGLAAYLLLAPTGLDRTFSSPSPPREDAGATAPAAAGSWCFQAGSSEPEIAAALGLCRSAGQEVCERDWYATETLREVCLAPFDLDREEVTVRQFADFVAETSHETAAERVGFSWAGPFKVNGLSWRRPDGEIDALAELSGHPVVHVSADDAAAYCRWNGGRLPTRDEWEYQARSADRRVFPWGDAWEPDRVVWGSGDDAATRPVGSLASGSGPRGHLDLAGNVWEWTASRDADGMQILKGGSYREVNPANLRSATELRSAREDSSADWGFRCAYDRD